MAAIKPRNRRLRRTLLALIFSGAYSSSTNLPTAPSLDLGGAAAAGFDLSAGINFDAMKEWAHQYIIDAYQSTPFCSWRLVSNTHAWNILFPDDNSIYHVTVAHIKKGDAFKISSDELPYARYFSFQTYDLLALLPTGAINDMSIKTEQGTGPNAYTNETAGKEELQQGAYEIFVTPDGNEGYPNEIRGLMGREEGDFLLFLRLYDIQHPPSTFNDTAFLDPGMDIPKCWETGGPGDFTDDTVTTLEDVQKFGWACPPQIQVKKNNSNLWDPSLRCANVRTDELPLEYNRVIDPGYTCDIHSNHPNNFYLPNTRMERGELTNYDAKYLMACAETQHVPRNKELWARFESTLPLTPTSLYEDPLVASQDDNELRYFSLSTVNRSPPGRVAQTLQDEEIVNHYTSLHPYDWDRRFVVWIGPLNSTVPPMVEDEHAMTLRWPQEYGDSVPFPGVIFRQILAQSQAVGDPSFKHGVADIVTPECPPNGTHHPHLHRGGDEGEGEAVDGQKRSGGGGFDGAGVKPRSTQRALRGGGGSGKEWKSDNGPKWLLESAVHQIHHFWRDDDNDDGHRPDWVDDDDAVSEDDWIEGGLHHCQDSDTRCCGDMIPKCCRMTGHVKQVMENYYPEIVYFAFDKETGLMETIESPEAH